MLAMDPAQSHPWCRCERHLEMKEDMVFSLMQNAVNAALLPAERKAEFT
jgi:hypothetical protein